jgi:hypothetical protein
MKGGTFKRRSSMTKQMHADDEAVRTLVDIVMSARLKTLSRWDIEAREEDPDLYTLVLYIDDTEVWQHDLSLTEAAVLAGAAAAAAR